MDGVQVDAGEWRSPLLLAIESRHLPAARALLEAGADVDGGAPSRTTLIAAVVGGDLEIVLLLIERGVSPKQTDRNGRTALHLAAIKSQLDLVERLVDHGVPLDAADQNGKTALKFADRSGSDDSQEVKRFLREAARREARQPRP